MRIGGKTFREVIFIDFEFYAPPGERPRPICMVVYEMVSGRRFRIALWGCTHPVPPFAMGPDVLFCAYYASAEIGCLLVLGWPVPVNVLDLFVEFRVLTNGRVLPCGSGLLGALAFYGLNPMDAAEKEEMRALAMRGGPYTADEMRALLEYCESDVAALQKLFQAILLLIDIERALLRGWYMCAAATMEHHGIQIDMDSYHTVFERWDRIQDRLIAQVDERYHVYEGRTFKVERFKAFLMRHGIGWPTLETGELALDDDTFKSQALLRPGLISELRELRYSMGQMRHNKLSIGRDGRNRCMLSAFRAKTGRNQPSNSKFIFGSACWLRSLIKAEPDHAFVYVDWAQQEFGIAASLSGDPAMMRDYISGDPYLRADAKLTLQIG